MATRLGGKYELVREIGSGGMGRVYEALDIETGQHVAAKVMIAGSEIDLQALLRFQQEGTVLATLKHPNIVTVYGTFLEGESCAIVMELLSGRSVGDLMDAGELPLARTKLITEQILAALAYAHSRGIVHRDVKPDNIMVEKDDRVKVTDFGIARILAPGATLNTRTGTTIGTPLYMSPEQIEGQKVDGRSDLYSLGTVLYQVVTGRPPFEGDDPLTVAFQHVHKAPTPPSNLNGEVPDDWEAMILRALAKSPADRYQSADAMSSVVSQLSTTPATPRSRPSKPDTINRIITPEITDEAPAPLPPRRPRATTAPRRWDRPWWPYATAVLALAVAITAAALGLAGRHTATHPSGTVLTSWGGEGSGPSNFDVPIGVAIGPGGTVYVADYDNNRISTFSSDGKPEHQWVLHVRGRYLSPTGVAVDRRGRMYVTDSDNNRILKLSPSGRLIRAWGTKGSGRGQLKDPEGIALARNGDVLVVDKGNARIVRFSPNGRPLRAFGSQGSAVGQFNYPVAVAVGPKGEIYVTDQSNYRIQRFSPRGVPVASWGSAGKARGQFQAAAGIAVRSNGRIFVTDSTLARLQEFSRRGKLLAVWSTKGTNPGKLPEPTGVAVDTDGNVYVADSKNDYIVKFAPPS